MDKPTIAMMLDGYMEATQDFETVDDVLMDTWRHGTEHQLILKRLADNTLWAVRYRRDKDNDYNSLRDGTLRDSDIYQVEAKEIKKTIYVHAKAQ